MILTADAEFEVKDVIGLAGGAVGHIGVVTKGQFVSQGDVIGTIGNTGVTTGPHLHYEVHIGSDVVDPIKYLNIKVSN